MAEELIARCSSLCIEDDEEDVVDLGGTEREEDTQKIELMLVGRLLTSRPYNAEAFKRTMEKVWMPANSMIVRTIAPNLYAFQFFHWKDKEKVLKGRPWCWENNLLILKEVVGDEQPENVPLNHSPFWIRVCNLPFNCRSTEDVTALTANIGELMEVEDDFLGLERYRRARVWIDVRKPLRRHQWMKDKRGNKVKVEFKYERLPFFCFACGTIGHSEKDCMVASEEEKNGQLGWGMFLRASPRKGHAKEMAELEALKLSRKQLFVTKKESVNKEEVRERVGNKDKAEKEGGEIIRVGERGIENEEERREKEAEEVGEEEERDSGTIREENTSTPGFVFRAERQKKLIKIRRRVERTQGEGDMEVDGENRMTGLLQKKRREREEGEIEKENGIGVEKRHKAVQQMVQAQTALTEVGKDQPRQSQ